MSKCLRCGKSLDGRRADARYCGATCRKAGFVAKVTGAMPSTTRGGSRLGAGRPPIKPKPVVAPKLKPKPTRKSKERLPEYVYRIESVVTDRKVTIHYGNGSYEAPVVEHYLLRYEVFTTGQQRYIYGFRYESALLAEEPTFDGLVWQWNRSKAPRESRCFLKRDNKIGGLVFDAFASKRVWGFTEKPHFSQKVIETQWRKQWEKTEAEKATAEAQQKTKSEPDFFDKLLEDLAAPKIKALLVLGVTKDASKADIKQAYRKLAAIHHPDLGGDTKAFVAIQDAYELLSR